MADPIEIPPSKIRGRSDRFDDLDADLNRLQDRVSILGERVSGLESGMNGMTSQMFELRTDFKSLALTLGQSQSQQQKDVLSTFYKMFIIFGSISALSIIGIVTVVGYGLSLKGLGIEVGSIPR